MPCSLCRQQSRAVLLPKSPQTSQNFPKTLMSSVRIHLGHSICAILLRLYGFGGQGKIARETPPQSTADRRNSSLPFAGRAFSPTDRRTTSQRCKERYRTAGRVLPRSPRGEWACVLDPSGDDRKARSGKARSLRRPSLQNNGCHNREVVAG